MKPLYALTDDYQRVLDLAEELDPQVLQDTLDSIKEEIDSKAENIAIVRNQMQNDIAFTKQEIERLTKRKKAIENNEKALKEYLLQQMELAGIKKIKGKYFDISTRKNVSLNVSDESHIPSEFFDEQKPKLRKTDLKNALKNGLEVDGVSLEQTESLMIR